MGNDPRLVETIKQNLASTPSEELKRILQERDVESWSEEAFEAAGAILAERTQGVASEPQPVVADDREIPAWSSVEISKHLAGKALPKRLSDPLLWFRRYFLVLLAIEILSFLCGYWVYANATIDRNHHNVKELGLGLRGSMVGIVFTCVMLIVLPWRRTNAIYLRSFRNDQASGSVRVVIQEAINAYSLRLSGIRAPGRRWPVWLRPLVGVLFCLHYSTPRYMNLEAGKDWYARLWRSLCDARCAFVDLTDVTEHVADEIRLAHRVIGLKRVLFIVDDSRDAASWCRWIRRQFGIRKSQAGEIRVAIAPGASRAERHRFVEEVRDFVGQIPIDATPIVWASFPLVRDSALTPSEQLREARSSSWQAALGIVVFLGFVAMLIVDPYSLLPGAFGAIASLSKIFLIGLFVVLFIMQAVFFIGSFAHPLKRICVLAMILGPSFLWVSSYWGR